MTPTVLSWFIGIIWIIVFPVLTTIVYADTERFSRRRDRLQVWQLVTLLTSTGLTVWTFFWSQPYGEELFFAEKPLWWSSGIGVAISIALGIAVYCLDRRHKALQERLIRAVLQP